MPDHRLLLMEPPFMRLFGETYSLVKYPLGLGYPAAAVSTAKRREARGPE